MSERLAKDYIQYAIDTTNEIEELLLFYKYRYIGGLDEHGDSLKSKIKTHWEYINFCIEKAREWYLAGEKKMKMAKVKLFETDLQSVIMQINEVEFGVLEKIIKGIGVGENRTIQLRDNDSETWGNFGTFFDDPEHTMFIEIIEMSEREYASLPEFDGF